MNNDLLIPLLVEASIFLIIAGFGYIIVAWRQKKKHLAEMDQLLKTIQEAEATRKQFFQNHLKNNCSLNDADASPIADSLMQSEKTFMHDFVANFFSSKHKTLAEFFNLTCTMTNSQLEMLPRINMQPATPEPEDIEQAEELEEITSNEENSDDPELTFDISIDEIETEIKETETIEEALIDDIPEDLTELSDQEINLQNKKIPDFDSSSTQNQPEKLADAIISLDDDDLESKEVLVGEPSELNASEREEPSWDDAFVEVEEPQIKVPTAKKDETSAELEKETILEQI